MIKEKDIREAEKILEEYRQGKKNLEARIIDDEQWYKMRHWEQLRKDGAPRPASGWLLNSVLNKHAEIMENFPEPIILPREQTDEKTAQALSKVIPVILEQNNYEKVYSNSAYDKIKTGTSVRGLFWNADKNDGQGDIEVAEIDLLSLFYEPGITDIQDSENVFYVKLFNNDVLQERYPKLNLGSVPSIDVAKYIYDDTVPTDGKSAVVDWYYKRERGGKQIVHFAKFVNGQLLFATENEKGYQDGLYAHGKYPFVFDVLFPEKGTPCGFGFIDAMKDAQLAIDKIDSDIQFNCALLAKPRYLISENAGINEKEFADWKNNFIHYSGSIEGVQQLPITSLESFAANYRQEKINELKEISGNRDVNSGGTVSGITAASAIASLQEAGNRLARDSIKASYRAYREEVWFIIELIRQFYNTRRVFRITNDKGDTDYINFDNSALKPQAQEPVFGVEFKERKPIFDVIVTAQKQNPYSKISQNDFAMQLYQGGFFNPEMSDQALAAIDIMQFDGKDKVVKKISENANMMKVIQTLQSQVEQLTQIVNGMNGTKLLDTGATNPGMPEPRAIPTQATGDIMDDTRQAVAESVGV